MTSFNPSYLGSRVKTWFDPSNPSNYSFDGSGSLVNSLFDSSENGNNANQTDWRYRPVIESASINGLDALKFKEGDALVFNVPSTVSTVFYVQYTTDTAYITVGSNTPNTYTLAVKNETSTNLNNLNIPSSNYFLNGENRGFTVRNQFYNYLHDRTSLMVIRDVNYGLTNPAHLSLSGYDVVTAEWRFSGLIGEVIFVEGELSDEEFFAMEAYLADKWGLKTEFPESHPFKYINPELFSMKGITRDKFGNGASRRVTLIDEDDYTVFDSFDSNPDGSFEKVLFSDKSFTVLLSGEPDRSARAYNKRKPERII